MCPEFAVTPLGRLAGPLQPLHRWSGIVCSLGGLNFDIDESLHNIQISYQLAPSCVCFYSFKICEGFLPNRHSFIQIVFTLKLVHLSTKPMSQLKHSTSYSWAPAVITFLHHCHMSRGFTSFYNNQMSLHKDKGECTPLTYSINCTTIYQGPLEGGCSLVQGVSVYIMT